MYLREPPMMTIRLSSGSVTRSLTPSPARCESAPAFVLLKRRREAARLTSVEAVRWAATCVIPDAVSASPLLSTSGTCGGGGGGGVGGGLGGFGGT